MGMLDRYKKNGGFIQLLILIESSSKQKQEQFFNIIAQENPAWESEIKKKSITLEKILSWNATYVSEIFSRVQPLTVAVAMRSLSQAQADKVMGCFNHSEQRKIQNIITETNPSPSEIQTCVMKLVTEVRELMKSGVLKMDKIDPELVIPENIEDKLGKVQLMSSIEKLVVAPASTLNFHKEEEKKAAVASPVVASGNENAKEDNESLKKKVQILTQENAKLKNEVNSLKSKLDQIKKIA